MTKIKSKVKLPRLESYAAMEAAFGQLAKATLRRDVIAAEFEEYLNDIRREHQQEHGDELEELAVEIAANEKRLLDWAHANEDTHFKTKRSPETKFGVMKFFRGQHKAEAKLKGGWKAVLEKIKDCGLAKQLIRTVEEPNKEALIAAREKVLRSSDGEFTVGDVGVKITQEETFTIEVAREPVAEPKAAQPAQAL
jgi:phage host-nuclease inhibitor protein Gam